MVAAVRRAEALGNVGRGRRREVDPALGLQALTDDVDLDAPRVRLVSDGRGRWRLAKDAAVEHQLRAAEESSDADDVLRTARRDEDECRPRRVAGRAVDELGGSPYASGWSYDDKCARALAAEVFGIDAVEGLMAQALRRARHEVQWLRPAIERVGDLLLRCRKAPAEQMLVYALAAFTDRQLQVMARRGQPIAGADLDDLRRWRAFPVDYLCRDAAAA